MLKPLKPRRPWPDTLLMRLFLLLWLTLVLSHAFAFLVVTEWVIPMTRDPVVTAGSGRVPDVVVFPSLPPSSRSPSTPGTPPGLPWPVLLLDYVLRLFVIGVGSWLGSRWLSRPVRRLVQAAESMSEALQQGQVPRVLDASAETLESRQAAAVFNRLASELHRAFRSRELLFAIVSHDLRTPMTRIRLRLANQPGPKELAQCIHDISEMDEMVRSALVMARHPVHPSMRQPVRVDVLLQAIVDDHADVGVTLLAHGLSDLPDITAWAEPMALRRVLDNVIQNALRHASTVRLQVVEIPDRQQVEVLVQDDGPGIPSLSSTPSVPTGPGMEAQAGHGLGLYIAQDLMRQQGGTLELCNLDTGGLQVSLRLEACGPGRP